MKYAKLINNLIEIAPQNKGAVLNYNTNVELMQKDGYKKLIEVELPITNRHYHIEYAEQSTQIKEIIVYDETQEEADLREKQEEHERIQKLNMTKLDFVKAIAEYNVSYEQIKTLLAANQNAQMEWDLCERVYRFNELLDVMAAKLGVTSEQLDEIFKERGQ